MKFRKLISAVTSIALSFSVLSGLNFVKPEKNITAEAAASSWKFDFGNGGTASGFTGVSASEGYSASKGYGFAEPANMADVSASGANELSDAVQFKSTSLTNTFNVDLDRGLYQVTVHLGNTNRTTVRAEGMLQIINMTGNNAVDTFQIPVTDGQLNIMATEGKAGYAFTMSSLEITRISSDPAMKPTIWICGDSTVCNYYPLATSVQGGWGQMLNQFVDTNDYEIRNMAASGQYAKGFVDAGQFDPIEYYGKSGDIYIISIGINDTNYSNADEYYTTVTDMVKRAKAKGMEVILVKQQGRNGDCSRNPLLTGRWFGTQLDTIGSEQNCQVIDLFKLWQDYCLTLSADAVTALYMDGDTLHPNRAGAIKLAELVASQINFGASEPLVGAVMDESADYMFRNAHSGQYMEVANASAAAGTNVQQWGADKPSAHNTWTVKAASDGYYYILSNLGDGAAYYLDIDYGKSENGTNIGIYTNTNSDAQLFKFVENDDGTYKIVTKVSEDKSAVEVAGASEESGANVQEWELNGADCQNWYAEKVTYPEPTTVPTTEPVTTVTATEPPTAPPQLNYTPGDADCSGDVTINDVVVILCYAADGDASPLSEDALRNADVYQQGDGVNASDAVTIQRYLAKIIASFDVKVPEITATATETTTAAEAVPEIYYAIDAEYVNGISETVNTGYKGDAYVNLDNTTSSYITWTVNAARTGNYLVMIRNANGTDSDRKMKIEVNGASDYWVQSFIGTGSWTDWAERGIVLPLREGSNTIKFTSLTENGGPNLDYITIELTDEPIAEIYIPDEEPDVPVSDKPVIYIAGDSTVQSYRESYAPQQGWGYYLGDYFTDNVTVSNHSIAGRSSKSFYDNGRLQTILDEMKEGDYLFVQFAINDSAASNAERYAPVCGNVDNPTEGSYEFYMEKYIEGALAKGGTPVLVTTVIGLKAYSNGMFVNSYGNYCQACKDMAAKYSIPCIDLNTLMVDHYNSIGYDAAYKYHLIGAVEGSTDMTHFTETGANAVAGLVADAVKKLNIPLSQYVK
ncbi:MAG: RICIN domain-containing protein [Oscillospiraceae bacterium]|nr:RICIN domain-containing protein [Oscillospiraceae bacterium]